MDLKKEVRRRIADLTQLAYERGYREGAQSALAEIESVTAEELVEHQVEKPLRAIGGTVPTKGQPSAKSKKPKAKKPKPRKKSVKANGATPKSITIQRCIQNMIAADGEARREAVLAAAQAKNAVITGHDLNNGIRTLMKRGEIRVDPEENSRLLGAEVQPAQP
jgi:hypothetical protein